MGKSLALKNGAHILTIYDKTEMDIKACHCSWGVCSEPPIMKNTCNQEQSLLQSSKALLCNNVPQKSQVSLLYYDKAYL